MTGPRYASELNTMKTNNLALTACKEQLTKVAEFVWGLVSQFCPVLKRWRFHYLTSNGHGVVLGKTCTNLISLGENTTIRAHLDRKDGACGSVVM